MATQRIFLDDNPGQTFSTIINGTRVVFEFRYNALIERFYFNMTADDVLLLSGRTLIGEIDVLSAFTAIATAYGSIVALDIDDQERPPTLENIAAGDVRVFLVTA